MTRMTSTWPGAVASLGLGLLALAGAIAWTAEGGRAHADGAAVIQRASGTQAGWNADRVAEGGGRRTLAPAEGATCVDGAPEYWFGEPREIERCVVQQLVEGEYTMPVDVNGDGVKEGFSGGADGGWYGIPVVVDGVPSPGPLLFRHRILIEEGVAVGKRSRLLDAVDVAGFAISRFGNGATVCTRFLGWVDVDLDADLDLVIEMSPAGEFGCDTVPIGIHVWLENIGFEAAQPLVGDLDGDDRVNSADLAILLGAWAP